MCELVEVPCSSFYAWATHTPSARDLADAELLDVIPQTLSQLSAVRVEHWGVWRPGLIIEGPLSVLEAGEAWGGEGVVVRGHLGR